MTTVATETDWRVFGPLELSPILAAASEAFYEHGFHGASVRDIVGRAGQTAPSLYYHHENKEGVLGALLELGTGDVAWRVKAAAAESTRPEDQLANVIEAIVLQMAHRTRLAALDSELRHLSHAKRKRYAARRKQVENLVRRIVEDGAEAGVFIALEPAETARGLLGLCQSIARWYKPGGRLRPEELADRYIRLGLLMVGLNAVTDKENDS